MHVAKLTNRFITKITRDGEWLVFHDARGHPMFRVRDGELRGPAGEVLETDELPALT
jgi:hypothetical protein